jgi:phosphoribosylformimino-5-aminoimidazole carboxamide ribotide isomerase
MTRFRPCIDLHAGRVKQIVGGSLNDKDDTALQTNFVSDKSAEYFAALYKEHDLHGAHVILLGPGNDDAAKQALALWPGGLQIGGGVNAENAQQWIELGAEKVGTQPYDCNLTIADLLQVIITSFLFPGGSFSLDRLEQTLYSLGGDKTKLVIDLSCRRKDESWYVAMNKWQIITDFEINAGTLRVRT